VPADLNFRLQAEMVASFVRRSKAGSHKKGRLTDGAPKNQQER
jgi:hypothetical protein